MRRDPDVIIVGEIRDQLAAEATIQVGLTGHKVFTILFTVINCDFFGRAKGLHYM